MLAGQRTVWFEPRHRCPDGSQEAVMVVHMLYDGKIIRTETGATPASK